MREFNGFGAFAAHLQLLAMMAPEVTHEMVDRSAELIQMNARDEIGFYQASVGPYPAWEELADSTEAEKSRLGFETGAPLLRAGRNIESIQRTTIRNESVVGSKDEVFIYHEFGTTKMPPRPVFGPAALHSIERIHAIQAASAFAWIAGFSVKAALKVKA